MRATAFVGVVIGFFCLSAANAAADEPFTLSLLTQDSLAGWDYGNQPIVGWSNTAGRLTGSQRATPLLAGWTLGTQFDLTFHWSVAPGGVLRLSLPSQSGGGRFDLLISQGDSCGALFFDNKLLSAGGNVPRVDGNHQSTLRRQGGMWQLFVDGQLVSKAVVPEQPRVGLMLAVAEGEASIENLRLDEPVGRPIFNGVDLSGWWSPRGLKSWPVVDGEITCLNRSGDYLRTEQEYANFTFSCEYKMRRGGNSGIGIRTARKAWPSGDGLELQLLDEPLTAPLTRSSTMGLYGNIGPIARGDKSEDWNRLVIKAEGYVISAWVNGVLAQHVNTARLSELKYRPLSGWIGIQDHGAWIRVRNVNLLPGPEGQGPAAWYAKRPMDASQLILERLMNSERLASVDGTRSGTTTKHVDDKPEQILAELAGPGAVVQITAPNASGRIAFYFDGESMPRIDCPVGELPAHVPDVAALGGNCATFLGYRQGLRIVLRDAEPGDYRIEHVAFPAGMAVQTFRDREESIARGMLPAISYRLQQMENGRLRDEDPAPRKRSSPQRIEPGNSLPLVQLDGAGTVQWWRLNAPRTTLDNDDLWIEITVDGETQPAISAPARYLFPGMKAVRGYENFVVTNYQGLVNRLAMPYANGLTIVAKNKGTRPLTSIGCSLSYEPQQAVDTAPLRLRGVFQAGDSQSMSVVSQPGRGRLVSIVSDELSSTSSSVELLVDESSTDSSHSLATWLGLPDTKDEIRAPFQGRHAGLVWRYFLLAPIEFERSVELRAKEGAAPGGRLALFYLAK